MDVVRSRRCAWWPLVAFFLLGGIGYGNPPASPAPTATPAGKPSPTAEHRAPAGVLYLKEDTTAPLEHGLQGIAAGTEVRLLKEEGDTVQVAAGELRFAVKKTQVTDNLDIVAAVRKRAAAIAAGDETGRQLQEAVLIKQQRDEIEFLRTHPLSTPTPSPGPRR